MEWRSKMEIVDVFVEGKPAAAIDGRPLRFPEEDVAGLDPSVESGLTSDTWRTGKRRLGLRNEHAACKEARDGWTDQIWKLQRSLEEDLQTPWRRKPQWKS